MRRPVGQEPGGVLVLRRLVPLVAPADGFLVATAQLPGVALRRPLGLRLRHDASWHINRRDRPAPLFLVSQALEQLLTVLDLERIELDIFRGISPDERLQRVFGGQVAGQALVAAGRTVENDRFVNSLHAYFLRGGDPSIPIVYQVDRLRDGRSFTTRRVVAVQHGKPIFNLTASFQLAQPGVEHQSDMPTGVPMPEDLPTFHERFAPYQDELGAWYTRPRPVDVRYVGDPPRAALGKGPQEPRSQVWLRADGVLPDDPLLQVGVQRG